MFDANEIIHCESYYKLADYHYKGQDDLPSGIVHMDTQGLPEFLAKVANNGKKYIVICSRSDFGLALQAEFPPWKDLPKWCEMMNEQGIGYQGISIDPRLDPARCKPTDKYSIRCWSFTSHTFNDIPANVKHIFLTNNFVYGDERITSIPFGVNGTDGSMEAVKKLSTLDTHKTRDKLIYMNFQFYTTERARLFLYFREEPWVTTYMSNRNIDEYYDDLATHKFVLCPQGNGPDCYRMLETMYAGAIPVIEQNAALAFYFQLGMPAIFCRSFYSITPEALEKVYDNMRGVEFNREPMKISYWKNLIESKRLLLS